MFDPLQPDDIAGAIAELLKDDDMRQDLIEKGLDRAASFSWATYCTGDRMFTAAPDD